LRHLCVKTNIYQDRLGTNTGKTQNKGPFVLRQSQAPVQPEAEAAHFVGLEHFPNVTKAREAAMEVVLQPGDALYLPPYWIHHVISESTTIR
jgi:hypothetical protein